MPHALLLSPDDQAVSSITGVLEELSVTFERPLDGVSAAQKLNSQSFDLVLVDCENLPAAKLIFDVCRRGKSGNNPVPIAIVDGRAGLPTAFRLGAELILTKPVAKDQARGTIRNAVSRVRRDAAANEAPLPPAATSAPENRACAAAASSQLTSFSEAAPLETEMFAPVDTATLPPKSNPRPAISSVATSAEASLAAPPVEISPTRTPELSRKPAIAFQPSDDPVLADLERAELDVSPPKELALHAPAPYKAAPVSSAVPSDAPVFSSYSQARPKARGSLVALISLALAGAGFYAAWTYQPGFRAFAEPQIDRLLALAGMPQPAQSTAAAPVSTKPAAQPAPPTTAVALPAGPDPTQVAGPDSAGGSAPAPQPGPANGSPATPEAAVALQTSAAVTPPAPVVNKTEVVKPVNHLLAPGSPGAQKDAAATSALSTPLPGESSTIILSSKGAERRLAHSVPPKYPADANLGDAQATVVLKEIVSEDGRVEGVRLVEGNPVLAGAAVKAVKQWRYRPYLRDGKALPFQTVVILDFQRP